MIKTVVREHHWSPSQVGDLYFDAQDYKGLTFWYQDALDCDNEIKSKTAKK